MQWSPFSQIVFTAVAAISFALVLTLPETNKQDLPQTSAEADAFGTKRQIRQTKSAPAAIELTKIPRTSITSVEKY